MEDVQIQVKGLHELARQLQALMLSPEEKKMWLYTICRRVAKQARFHTRTQTNIDGSRYAPRKHGKKKMERKITKFSLMKVFGNALQARVAYKNHLTGVVARMQQEGISTKASKKSLANGKKKFNPLDPCTHRQAEALIDVGYKRRMKGGKLKRVSIRWLTENMTMGQAGLIYRMMGAGGVKEKPEWTIPLPARSFLGANEIELYQYANEILEAITSKVQGKSRFVTVA